MKVSKLETSVAKDINVCSLYVLKALLICSKMLPIQGFYLCSIFLYIFPPI